MIGSVWSVNFEPFNRKYIILTYFFDQLGEKPHFRPVLSLSRILYVFEDERSLINNLKKTMYCKILVQRDFLQAPSTSFISFTTNVCRSEFSKSVQCTLALNVLNVSSPTPSLFLYPSPCIMFSFYHNFNIDTGDEESVWNKFTERKLRTWEAFILFSFTYGP